jgi:pimeloyl-ACP methyl ester carboxylesterase
MTPPPAQVFLTVDGLSTLPLAEYLEFRPPPAPSTIETIENLDHIEFDSGGQKLAGRLLLPEGEGPFPAIVFTGPGSGLVTRFDFRDAYADQLLTAGFAVFSYDKRGVGDSEGLFMQINALGNETSEWRLPQLADDALAAVAFLQNLGEINPDQIGLWGASQNGWTIPLAASLSSAPAFAVIVSGATVSLGEEDLYSELTEAVDPLPDDESLRAELSAKMANFDGVPGFDPREAIETMSIPGLWIWGDRDGSMPARESKAILESIIAEHDKDFTIFYDPDAGHRVAVPMSETVEWILSQIEK